MFFTKPQSPVTHTTPPAKKLRIVLIDDDHGPMDLFVQALKERGFDVSHLDRTALAVEFVNKEEGDAPALIIMDLMMPYGTLDPGETKNGVQTGAVLINLIRRNPRLRFTPIICLSNYDNEEEARQMVGPAIPFVGKYETTPFEFADSILQQDFIKNLLN